jgi:hypothetical protein
MGVAVPSSVTTPIVVPADSDILLPVPYYTQKPEQNLCWAACCAMVLGYYHQLPPPGGLSYITSTVLGPACSNPAACDQTFSPFDAYSKLKFPCKPWDAPFDMAGILHELGAGRPLQLLIQWGAGNIHTILVSGYYAATQDLNVLDPYNGVTSASYDFLQSGYGMGEWVGTFYNLQP